MRRTLECCTLAALASTGWSQVTQRMSVNSTGVQGNWSSGDYSWVSISADGRYVALVSLADNLVPGDTNGVRDVFVRDRGIGTTERISVDSAGLQANGPSDYSPDHSICVSISADGRYVAFESRATNLVPGDTNGKRDIFIHDRQSGTTERVSLDSNGVQGDGESYLASNSSISADGRYVAFVSFAKNLVPGDTNRNWDVFVRDRQSGTTERASVSSAGVEGDWGSGYRGAAISADGRYVAFESAATNLVPGDTNAQGDIFVRDLAAGTTERVSLTTNGGQVSDSSEGPSISADGRFVAFASHGYDLHMQVLVRDRWAGTTQMVSVGPHGQLGDSDSYVPSISADGRYLGFMSVARNLVSADSNGAPDVFVRDLQNSTTELLSVDSAGIQGNFWSSVPSVSADGRFVAFASDASNLVPEDTNASWDVFVRDRAHRGFTSLCDPGVSGVLGCPCSNAPSGPDRGCDNSSATGGASLSVSGGEYLSSDSLLFTTNGEGPTALSIVMQGTNSIAAGTIYGQGVRCVGGSLKRLYAKAAIGGSITAPDFGAGDATVHARSAAVGDVIAAGSTRWYMVFYRDLIVLGGCAAGSTFNTTQTRAIPWLP